MEKWLTACPNSRTLAQYSTKGYAGGLYCRVRNGTGCDPAAMAVIPRVRISIPYITVAEFRNGPAGLIEVCIRRKDEGVAPFGLFLGLDRSVRASRTATAVAAARASALAPVPDHDIHGGCRGSHDQGEHDHRSDGQSESSAVSAPFSLMKKKGSFMARQYVSSTTPSAAATHPAQSISVPPIRLPSTYTMADTK